MSSCAFCRQPIPPEQQAARDVAVRERCTELLTVVRGECECGYPLEWRAGRFFRPGSFYEIWRCPRCKAELGE